MPPRPGVADVTEMDGRSDLAYRLIRRAIAEKRVGDFVIHADLKDVETGRIEAHGQGLYLPVRVGGYARITYRPQR